MATTYLTSNIIGAGVAFTIANNDTLVVPTFISAVSTGSNAISAAFNATVKVDGTVFGGSRGIFFDGGAGSVSNLYVGQTGQISSDLNSTISATNQLNLTNYGQITCLSSSTALNINGGLNEVSNFGSISSLSGIAINASGIGTLRLVNAGTISAGDNSAIRGTSTGDTILNTGFISGNVSIGNGADLYDGRGGRVIGDVLGGTGNDTLYGGLGADKLFGDEDSDTLYFDAEDLSYGAVFGGAGYDTGYYTDNATPITINLTSQQFEAYYGSAADEMIIAGSLGGFGGFVRSGAGNDLFDGSAQADIVDGGLGIDVLYGRGGADELAGGNGGDWLQGGLGADTFRYNSLTDSTVNGQDFIADFSTAQGDKINLTNALAGLGAVTFNTGYGAGTSVYVFAGGGGTSLVQVYTDTTLQMQIVASQAGLVASDFVF